MLFPASKRLRQHELSDKWCGCWNFCTWPNALFQFSHSMDLFSCLSIPVISEIFVPLCRGYSFQAQAIKVIRWVEMVLLCADSLPFRPGIGGIFGCLLSFRLFVRSWYKIPFGYLVVPLAIVICLCLHVQKNYFYRKMFACGVSVGNSNNIGILTYLWICNRPFRFSWRTSSDAC